MAEHIGTGLAEVMGAVEEARAALDSWRPPAVRAAEVAAAEERDRQRRRADHEHFLRGRGVPEPPAKLIADGKLTDTSSLQQAARWLRSVLTERSGGKRAWRVRGLAGEKDAAKTTAASWLVDKWPWKRAEELPIFLAVEDLQGAWMAHSSEDPVSGLSRRALMHAGLLVIDDVGQEPSNPTLAAILAEILDTLLRRRCDLGLSTCITTNELSIEALCSRYATRPRIAERLTEFAVWADCPREGFRDKDRRAQVLEQRRAQKART